MVVGAKSFLKDAVMSIVCGMIVSGVIVIIALETLSSEESIFRDIVFWNLRVAKILVETEWLPICFNCEYVALITFLFYGFVIGVVGYSIVIFAIMSYLRYVKWFGKE